MPLISIIIPCYNVETYLDRCFESLINQTIGIENLELIFVDDASTDHTWEKLTQIEASCPDHVMILRLPENMRQGGARNAGLQYATCDYIGYVDSDDWTEPDMYEKMYEAITQTGSDIAFCRHIRDNGKEGAGPRPMDASSRVLLISCLEQRREFILSSCIGYGVWDKLYRRSLLIQNDISFPEHLAYEDIYFGSLIYLYAQKVVILEEKLYHYFVNTDSTVLKKDCAYHEDLLFVNNMKWDAYETRGFLKPPLKQALELDYLMTGYLAGFKMLCLRYTRIPYELFQKLKSETLKRVPDYTANPYCSSHVPELYRLILSLLTLPVTQEMLTQIQQQFCAIYQPSSQSNRRLL